MTDLAIFYQSPIGKMARDFLWARMRKFLSRGSIDTRTLIIGYGAPYAEDIAAQVGGEVQQSEAADRLPFYDVMFDNIIVIHALEFTPDATRMMAEIQRVLAVSGRVICIAPHRAGMWSWFEHTPFGTGHVFSRAHMRRLCTGAQLSPIETGTALFPPPVDFSRYEFMRTIVRWIEAAGTYLDLPCGGAVVGFSQKQRYAGIGLKSPVRNPVPTRLQWAAAHVNNRS